MIREASNPRRLGRLRAPFVFACLALAALVALAGCGRKARPEPRLGRPGIPTNQTT